MTNNDQIDLQLERMLEKNYSKTTKKYYEAYANSENKPKIEYKKQKKKIVKNKVNRAITSVALAVGIVLGATASHAYINNTNIVISKNETSNSVDDKIEHYINRMKMKDNNNEAIEIFAGHKNFSADSLVNYDIENFAKHINNAAKISEEETRCVIIAGYNIINAPYRNQIIGQALSVASSNQNEEYNYDIPDSAQEFLQELGYKDWKEYQLNERENIKNLKAVEDYLQNKSGKVL